MSLSVYLTDVSVSFVPERPLIFIRENGQTKGITHAEWNARHPDRPAVEYEALVSNEVFNANITHNLAIMADAAGVYMPVWRPDEVNITKAEELVQSLVDGIRVLRKQPDVFKQYNPDNGWGSYETLVEFLERYLIACLRYPNAVIEVSR